jgi:hypothetical protein
MPGFLAYQGTYMKPHLETWTLYMEYDQDMGPALFTRINDASGDVIMSATAWDVTPDVGRLALMTQAPAMARLLLEQEWSGTTWYRKGREYSQGCPTCKNAKAEGHTETCKLAKTLKLAGVID